MAIHATQDMIGEVLLKDEQNKKLLIRTQMDDSEVDFDSLTWDDEDDDRELVTLDYDWNDGNDNKVFFKFLKFYLIIINQIWLENVDSRTNSPA